MKRKLSGSSFLGVLLFFVNIAAVVTVVLLVYTVAEDKLDTAEIAVVMLSVILALTLVASLCDWIRRNVLVDKPVKKILQATDKIASGDFGVRIDIEHSPRRYNEFDYIMDNINKMAGELQHTEILHNDFVSNVSHEIKTPIAVIQNYATCLADGDLDEATRKEYASVLVATAKRLNVLVADILRLNKLENQQLTLSAEPINLADMLAECALNFVESVDSKGLDFFTELDDVVVTSSRAHLEIIFNNLIGNAVKFTDKGEIRISCKNENGKAVVQITDTGCGISQEVGAHIFDKFYQGDTSHSTEGNGLGLALVKKVIDVLGGEIAVNSVVGKGTTFTVKLDCNVEKN